MTISGFIFTFCGGDAEQDLADDLKSAFNTSKVYGTTLQRLADGLDGGGIPEALAALGTCIRQDLPPGEAPAPATLFVVATGLVRLAAGGKG